MIEFEFWHTARHQILIPIQSHQKNYHSLNFDVSRLRSFIYIYIVIVTWFIETDSFAIDMYILEFFFFLVAEIVVTHRVWDIITEEQSQSLIIQTESKNDPPIKISHWRHFGVVDSFIKTASEKQFDNLVDLEEFLKLFL